MPDTNVWAKIHRNSQTPAKKTKLRPLSKEQKADNLTLARKRILIEISSEDSSWQGVPHFERAAPQQKKAFQSSFQFNRSRP